jgi:hypothetical protein
MEKDYKEFTSDVLRTYYTYEDYIKCKVLKYSYTITRQGKRKAVVSRHSYMASIVRNKFPYQLPSGVKHYVLWSVEPLEPNMVDALLLQNFGNKETSWFVNPTKKKSIKKLWHCHVLVYP